MLRRDRYRGGVVLEVEWSSRWSGPRGEVVLSVSGRLVGTEPKKNIPTQLAVFHGVSPISLTREVKAAKYDHGYRLINETEEYPVSFLPTEYVERSSAFSSHSA